MAGITRKKQLKEFRLKLEDIIDEARGLRDDYKHVITYQDGKEIGRAAMELEELLPMSMRYF